MAIHSIAIAIRFLVSTTMFSVTSCPVSSSPPSSSSLTNSAAAAVIRRSSCQYMIHTWTRDSSWLKVRSRKIPKMMLRLPRMMSRPVPIVAALFLRVRRITSGNKSLIGDSTWRHEKLQMAEKVVRDFIDFYHCRCYI